ncbi:DMT family transporter [Consotaella salsifontis]|uniref:DMT family transporter n=1 Tax=Consotaella salsifontis TaxID=1365950 RepID=UPI0013F63508|nr:DMT family transporter [Consotaella salsifontis]
MVAGFSLYSAVDALTKYLSLRYSILQILLIDTLVSLLPITLIGFVHGKGWRGLSIRSLPLHSVRAMFGLGAMILNLYAFAHMPLADAYAILFSGPLVMTALSSLMFKEKVAPSAWAAIAGGFAGILVMLRPSGPAIGTGALSAVLGVLCFSFSALIIRHFGQNETPISFPLYGNGTAAAAIACLLAFGCPGGIVTPTQYDLGVNVVAGLILGIAATAVLAAFRAAPASVVSPFQYYQMVWAVLLGWLIFGDTPTPFLGIGGSLIIGSGLYLLRTENRRAQANHSTK